MAELTLDMCLEYFTRDLNKLSLKFTTKCLKNYETQLYVPCLAMIDLSPNLLKHTSLCFLLSLNFSQIQTMSLISCPL